MIYDISPPLKENTAVWPGDTPFRQQWLARLTDGANIDLSGFSSTVHIGAHADAPSHFALGAQTIDQLGLEAYWGPCVVVSVIGKNLIDAEDLAPALSQSMPRILVRTRQTPAPDFFPEEFAAFSSAAIEAIGKAGVVLVGIDTPSVDPFSSKDLPAHQALLRYGIRNLEGLDFTGVDDGCYELVALPLRLVGFDASPVRAVLRTLK